MILNRPILALFLLGFLASIFCCAQGVETPLFNATSKDKLVRRKVFSNGDFCQVREYVGDEHTGIRVVYLLTERSLSEPEVRTLIKKLANEFCGKRETPLIRAAVDNFKPAKPSDHWIITLQNPDYAEFFIAVDWLGESVTIQIKYYQ